MEANCELEGPISNSVVAEYRESEFSVIIGDRWSQLPSQVGDLWWLYRLRDPRDRQIRWIGSTINPRQRYSAHFYANGSCLSKSWIKEIRDNGLRPSMELIFCGCGNSVLNVERIMILRFQELNPGQLFNRKKIPLHGISDRDIAAQTKKRRRWMLEEDYDD